MPDVRRELRGDPLRLRQILINLIGNAIKFTETGQVLRRVECGPRAPATPGALLFTVSDTGIGMPSDKLDAVFANFSQADSRPLAATAAAGSASLSSNGWSH